MLHDPDVFTNPMKFDPDRYHNLDSEMEKVNKLVFGFGRRLCPGKAFGEATVFAIAATVLATCNIYPTVDENGNNIIPDVVYSSGLIRQALETVLVILINMAQFPFPIQLQHQAAVRSRL
jgi:hypothetical protein